MEEAVARAGIQHVALLIDTADAERACEFWHLVGFERVEPPPTLSERAIWMQAGSAHAPTQIHLLFKEPEAPTEGSGVESGDIPPFGGHVAVIAPAFEATVSALLQAGFPVEMRRPHWGADRAFAEHPGGHTVELMAAPPPPAPAPR